MKRIILGLSIVVSMFLMAQSLPASEIRGIVIKADQKGHEITLEARGKGWRGVVLRIEINDDTQVRQGKQEARFADLAPGKRVRILFEEREGRRIASTIQIVGLPALFPSPGEATAPGVPMTKDANAIAGVLRRISVTGGEIVVVSVAPGEKVERETTLVVADNAKIVRSGQPIRLEELKEGEPVVVHADKNDGKLLARSIEAGSTAGISPATPPRETRIEKVRRILQRIDGYLQMVGGGPPE
jgi:hypothetical protein